MLFNSYGFLLVFLPLTWSIYFLLNKYTSFESGKFFLLLASVVFYSWWNPVYVFLLLFTILFNFVVGRQVSNNKTLFTKKALLVLGVTVNLSLLAYYKYCNFFIDNANSVLNTSFSMREIILPLGISFISFQTIAFLVDCYKGQTKEYNLVNYSLFVTFFPQLIAGPIVHHGEMLPQFAQKENKYINYENLLRGSMLVMLGLVKKVVIADTFAIWANNGFDIATTLNFAEAWITSLSYTFQLYYDFSGYCDMAVGVGLMFNIRIPFNFNSPYKARGIADFWRRWHITLSRFLRDYLYIPLGGNKKGFGRELSNLLIVFVLGGLWHGAAWTFVFWGFLHGAAIIVERLFRLMKIKLPVFVSWLLTFTFVNAAWVFFRADSWADAIKVLKGMVGLNGIVLPESLERFGVLAKSGMISFGEWNSALLEKPYYSNRILFYLVVFSILSVFFKNSQELLLNSKFRLTRVVWIYSLFLFALVLLGDNPQFLYFNF
jgi:D-alanyl-lipoteichoic acid acyltransferase DltB (MBOAT superfamily)